MGIGKAAKGADGVTSAMLFALALIAGPATLACDEHGWEWTRPQGSNAPPADHGFLHVVWTGEEMLAWNEWHEPNDSYVPLLSGRAYNPSKNSWRIIPGYQPVGTRRLGTVVWSGNEMLVWGGSDSSQEPANYEDLNTGAAYNPETNTWRSLATLGAPEPRSSHVALWTPSGMLIWGGTRDYEVINSGGIYDPDSDTWMNMGSLGAPVGRWEPAAVITDGQLLLWGGCYFETTSGYSVRLVMPSEIARYTLETGKWIVFGGIGTPQLPEDAILGENNAFWISEKLYVWGFANFPISEGFIYDPQSNIWSRTSKNWTLDHALLGQPFLVEPSVVWTGYEILMWNPLGVGAHYNPSTNLWKTSVSIGKPSPSFDDLGRAHKYLHNCLWTGEELLTIKYGEGLYSYRPKCLNLDRRNLLGSCELHPDHWVESTWLGWFHDLHFPWIFHSEHQWMYATDLGGDWIGLWDGSMGWLLTHLDSYPNLYQSDTGHWLYYSPGTQSPRWFYDYNTGKWIAG